MPLTGPIPEGGTPFVPIAEIGVAVGYGIRELISRRRRRIARERRDLGMD
jgi:hypothetical protein